MKPSLLTLFQRGRYHRLPRPEENESEELVRERKEAERFTAAAMGFCVEHHARFRRFLIEKLCGVTLTSNARCEVDIEPQHWADLMIHFGRRKVAVVEFKLGAPLQPHQNPTADEFWEDSSGYGTLLGEAYPNHEKHFVVLGSREWLGELPKREGWCFREVRWAEIAEGFAEHFHRTPLLCDLRDCLAQFGVWEFGSMKAHEFSVSPFGAANASMVWEILWAAYTAPDLKFSTAPSFLKVDAEFTRPSQWHFGIEVQAGANELLTSVTRPSRGGVLWFGYECERRDEVWQSIWLYCETETLAEQVAARFRPGKRSSERLLQRPDEKGRRTHIGIRRHSHYSGENGLSWFVGLLGSICDWAQRANPHEPTRRRRKMR